MEQFIKLMLGEQLAIGDWAAYSLLYAIGAMIYLLIKYIHRKDKSTKFYWAFWTKDNFPSVLLSVVMMFIVIRMYSDISPLIKDTTLLKYEMTQVGATLALGVLNQRISRWLAGKLGLKSFCTAEEYIKNSNN
jgi:hypothetical protein